MKLISNAILSLVLSSVLAGVPSAAGQRLVGIVGPVEDITFGSLINAPNGHISFQKEPGGYRIWLPGRLSIPAQNLNEEGGFLFEVPSWSSDDLAQAQPTYMDLGHTPKNCDPGDFSFDRNYAAPNAVLSDATPHVLLAFYDAEYHVACPSGEPLLSSIGLATSVDDGLTWQRQGQVIQGLDEARKGFAFVTQKQLNEFNNGRTLEDGASGPSALVRDADGKVYLYLYYADRTPITGGPDSIYLARSLLTTHGNPGTWQQWTGAGWSALGDQTSAAPILVPSTLARSALQPHVSWNTALQCWLMVFKTKIDFEVATSVDGINWSQASSLLTFDPNDQETGFPTLISLNGGAADEFGPNDDELDWLLPSRQASQQITSAVGWLYYSSHPANNPQYIGHRAPFRISAE